MQFPFKRPLVFLSVNFTNNYPGFGVDIVATHTTIATTCLHENKEAREREREIDRGRERERDGRQESVFDKSQPRDIVSALREK